MVYFNFFCCFLLPLAAMFIMYSHIFITVRRQLKRIAVTRPAGSGATETEDTGSSVAGGSPGGEPDSGTQGEARGRRRTWKAEVGAGKETESGTGSLIETNTTAVFTKPGIRNPPAGPNCCNPAPTDQQPQQPNMGKSLTHHELRKAISFFLVLFLFMVCWLPIHLINCILLFSPQSKIPMSLTLGTILLSHANSALNPILYAYRMRSFRHTLIGMMRDLWSNRSERH